jgi:dual specificity MAP kinase phosphatase
MPSPKELVTKLRKSKSMLLVDCRPFVSYNIAHINGAVNVNCSDRFNRKRLQQGKASLVDLVTSKDGIQRLRMVGVKLPNLLTLASEMMEYTSKF